MPRENVKTTGGSGSGQGGGGGKTQRTLTRAPSVVSALSRDRGWGGPRRLKYEGVFAQRHSFMKGTYRHYAKIFETENYVRLQSSWIIQSRCHNEQRRRRSNTTLGRHKLLAFTRKQVEILSLISLLCSSNVSARLEH